MKRILRPTKIGLVVVVVYSLVVIMLWADSSSCNGLFCEVPLAISSWPLGILADTHTIEELFNLPLNAIADETIIAGQLFNVFLFLAFGNWISRKIYS